MVPRVEGVSLKIKIRNCLLNDPDNRKNKTRNCLLKDMDNKKLKITLP